LIVSVTPVCPPDFTSNDDADPGSVVANEDG
jgi:hypothetical protein